MTKHTLIFIFCLFVSTPALARIKTENVEYTARGTVMEGKIVYSDAANAPRPGILIVHDWMGPGPYVMEKAKQLAGQGYVAFVVDAYGKDIRPKSQEEAADAAGALKNHRDLLRIRMRAAFDELADHPRVDSMKIVVMGYCFGGTAALELARSGAPLSGTVSFHGGLTNPSPQDARDIKGRVLVLHGADDPHVPPSEVQAFKEEMAHAGAKMKFVSYPNAVHSFTNPAAGNDPKKGAAYLASADRASWKEFQAFLKEIFRRKR